MRVLFLDDREERIEWARERYGRFSLFIARTTKEALLMLVRHEFDLVSLDHDLNHESFVDSNRKDCGMEVVRWIAACKPTIPKIVVHSANGEAASRMVEALATSGYNVVHEQAGA